MRSTFGRAGWSAAAALLAVLTAEEGARAESTSRRAEVADALVVPGPTGLLGTYRVLASRAGPMAAADERALASQLLGAGGPAGQPRLLVDDDGKLDLSLAAGGGATAYLGLVLHAPRATTVHLLVGLRGGVSVQLDGEEVAAHGSSRYRPDEAHARLELGPGRHALVLRFSRAASGGRPAAQVRWLDERFRPGAGEVELSVGRLQPAAARDAAARAVRVEEEHVLGETGPEVVVRASLPAGGLALPVSVVLGTDRVLRPEGGLHGGVVEHRAPMPERGRLELRAEVEGRPVRLGRTMGEDRPVLAAAAELAAVLETAPAASKAPLAWRLAEMTRVVATSDPDAAWRRHLAGEARRLARAVGEGGDPFAEVRGYERMGFHSRLDGTPRHYELFVPPAYDHSGAEAWPLLVTLHGHAGNAGDYFRNTFGLHRDYSRDEPLLEHGRHGEVPRSGPMFVVAPTGRGQAMYRHAGEADVLEVLDDVRRRFRIDEDRIYITGGSMGGTGAAYIPYRHPDLFAASAALAGYHDQRVRRDTNHDGLSELERYLRAVRSDVDWAENGLHMHTWLIRGTRDWPLEWTRSLARRLERLGYPYRHDEPVSRHNVWTATYAGGAIFRHFEPFRRPASPREVRLRTARERTRSSYWVSIDERAAPDRFAEVHARVDETGRILVRTEGVHALTLSPGEGVVPDGPLRVSIDGHDLEGESPLALHVGPTGAFEPAPHVHPAPGRKRDGASGPIRDVYHDALLFVVGTADPGHTVVNRLVAEHWARPHGWDVDYPIVDDVDVTDELLASHSLVLVGPPGSNRVLDRWADLMPITIDGEGVGVGPRCYAGPEVGTVFVAPSPAAPDRSVLVVAGPSPLGTWRSIFLPDILPDFVVFDDAVAPARDQWAAGGTGARYLEAGLFGLDWSVPPTPYD